jgi:YD repeat-containing protein
MRIRKFHLAWLPLLLSVGYSFPSFSADYYWLLAPVPDVPGTPHYNSASEACAAINYVYETPAIYREYYYVGLQFLTDRSYRCLSNVRETNKYNGQVKVVGPGYYVNKDAVLRGDKCQQGKNLNPRFGKCSAPAGKPDSKSCKANPVDISTGNKFQVVEDVPSSNKNELSFVRTYNGVDGVWRHTYGSYTRSSTTHMTVVGALGEEHGFTLVHVVATPETMERGTMVRTASYWQYTSETNESYFYDLKDKLIKIVHANGSYEQLTYSGSTVTVTNNTGKTLTFTQDVMRQPLTVNALGLSIQYQYNAENVLTQVTTTRGSDVEIRLYHYEDQRNSTLLTGITNEKGVRFATWAYDEQGRAISSEHANGAEHTQISYNEDGSSTVTNALGKKTVYRFTEIAGVKKVSAIEGEPSANCPASNSTFTYNDRGQVLTQTDAKGFITTHTYNDRGLETTRTEATGTPQARTTTTTWHATFNLPLTVTEGGQVTTYTYDTQGRQTSRTQTAL